MCFRMENRQEKQEIKAIIFDYGGVISLHGRIYPFCEKWAIKLNKDLKKFRKMISENWFKASINRVNSKLFWKRLANFLKIDTEIVRAKIMKYMGFRQDVFELVKRLKKNYKVALLSNQIEDWLGEIIKEKNFKEVFDVIVTSYTSKIAKPDIRIFKETVEKLEVKPEECVYIDDLEKNIPPAEKLGMKTILFKNNKQLINDLKKFGVEV